MDVLGCGGVGSWVCGVIARDDSMLRHLSVSVSVPAPACVPVRCAQVLREAIGNKVHGITMKMLRGHEGATALAVRLRDALGSLLQEVNEDVTAGNAGSAASAANGNKYVVFSARNKAAR